MAIVIRLAILSMVVVMVACSIPVVIAALSVAWGLLRSVFNEVKRKK